MRRPGASGHSHDCMIVPLNGYSASNFVGAAHRLALGQSARMQRYLWSMPAASPLLWPNDMHAHSPKYQQGIRRERCAFSWCQRSTARAEGLRFEEVRVLTRLGRPNQPSSMGERLGSIIPLEELPTGTPILDMRALSQIKVVRKFPGAGRAAHGLIPFGWCVPLLAYGRLIIHHLSSKR